ncbi:MAG: hypothetical protein HYX28_07020 [Candidatus Koribacter versatilis]|uniref:Ig-like domain-containing protein n=1 Tax=Candidatus Korobacter versatilis TaxID=658062 RepID=A0A932A8M7_9BACT|nr:hypothetical protein [Candidatus Koribacter versatilis]
MQTRKEGSIRRAVALVAVLAFTLLASAAFAQSELPDPRMDVFVGYSYYNPGDQNPLTPGIAPSMVKGFNSAVTWNFNRYVGLTFDTSGHYSDKINVGNFGFGPTIRYPMDHFIPFAHALFGFQKASPLGFSETEFLTMIGGGMDLRFTKLLSWRVLQADWVRSNHSFTLGSQDEFNGVRLSSGLVFNLGSLTPPVPPAATCSASPAEVMESEGVTVTASPSNFNPKHELAYDWKSSGGKATGNGATAQIDTTGMTGGSYTASAHVTDKKNSKMMADCTASFTVKDKPKNPPQIACSANPATVQSGQPSTISCTCTSPDNAQLQPLAWTTSMGKIAGEGMNATLDTSGMGAGSATVTTTCTDARGLSSTASTNVNVEVPQKLEASKINECAFPNKVKPARVDNTCKAALDDVALRMQREADAKVVIVGMKDAAEKPKDVDAHRATNTKDYLVTEKQIDASRLETRTGADGGRRVEIYLVPAGATFNEGNTTVVTAPAPKPMKKKAAKKPAQ